MKKFFFSLAMCLATMQTIVAMSYEEARQQALFLTDKMAYELNLNDQQYEDCYEINLDYLLSVETADDVYGNYLSYRNADLRHILLDWQYTLFAAADYFLHPLYWHRGAWHYPIYRYYTVGHFYYGRPSVYFSYHGGHGRFYHTRGFYGSRRPEHWGGGFRGMDRGPVAHHGGRPGNVEPGRNGNYSHPSSTRTTVHSNVGRSSSIGHSSPAGRSSSIGHSNPVGRSSSMGHSSPAGRSSSMGSRSGMNGGMRSAGPGPSRGGGGVSGGGSSRHSRGGR